MTRRSEVGIDITARNMASREIEAVGGSLNKMAGSAQTAEHHTGILGGVVKKVSEGIFLGVGLLATQAFARGMALIPNAVIGMNASLESSTLQFETLFRDADRAREHVAMLFEFAKKTPFETQPIIQASRTMQTFGGDALNTQKNLTLVGDAAAGASTDIGQVAFWVSRAYAAIQGGQPFGEARMRLQELALLSPQAAAEMEKLQKAGASATEVWSIMEKELGKFNGAMEKQASTWSGLTSTLSDTLNLTLAEAFRPFFEYAKEGLQGLIVLFSSPGFQQGLKDFAKGAIDIFRQVIDIIKAIWPVVQTVFGAWVTYTKALLTVYQNFIGFVDRFKLGIMIIAGVIGAMLIPTLIGWAAAQLAVLAPWIALGLVIAAAAVVLTGIASVIIMVVDALAKWLMGLAPVQAAIDIFLDALGVLGDALGWVGDRLADVGEFFGLTGDDAETAAEQVGDASQSMKESWKTGMAGMKADTEKTGQEIAFAVRDKWEPPLKDAMGGVEDSIVDPVSSANAEVVAIMHRTPSEMADALVAGQNAVDTAAEQLAKAMENPISTSARIAALQGTLASSELAEGLKSNDPMVRAAAVKLRDSVNAEITALRDDARRYGKATAVAYADGITSAGKYIHDSAQNAVGQASRVFRASSPPGPESPLHQIDVWGMRTAQTWVGHFVEGIKGGIGDIKVSLANVGAAMAPPTVLAPAAAAGGGGGNVVVSQTFNFGPGSVRSDDDVRRLGVEMQERAQLQGFAATSREVGRVV